MSGNGTSSLTAMIIITTAMKPYFAIIPRASILQSSERQSGTHWSGCQHQCDSSNLTSKQYSPSSDPERQIKRAIFATENSINALQWRCDLKTWAFLNSVMIILMALTLASQIYVFHMWQSCETGTRTTCCFLNLFHAQNKSIRLQITWNYQQVLRFWLILYTVSICHSCTWSEWPAQIMLFYRILLYFWRERSRLSIGDRSCI